MDFKNKQDSVDPKPKRHVVTRDEAIHLLNASHAYFFSNEYFPDGRHMAEVAMQAMANDGRFDLSSELLGIHDAMKGFHSGKFKEAERFVFSPVEIASKAKGSKFEGICETIARSTAEFVSIFAEKEIDWVKSSKVLGRVKAEIFPQDLTMIERLDKWQGQKGTGKTL